MLKRLFTKPSTQGLNSKMKDTDIDKEFSKLSTLIDEGNFNDSFIGTNSLLKEIEKRPNKDGTYYCILFNIAGLFIDIGHRQPNMTAASHGRLILENNKDKILEEVEEHTYYYNLSNAAANFIEEKDPFKQTFDSIEKLVDLKSLLWKSVKLANKKNGQSPPTFTVNLGNALKQQFRIVEALACYDEVNEQGRDISQSWINRSETLILLNQVSSTYSIQMLEQVKHGYEKVVEIDDAPPQWKEYYRDQVSAHQSIIDDRCEEEGITQSSHGKETTAKEYEALSDFRKFCLNNNLALSEHGLYCKCAGSARDNLTIPTLGGLAGDFIVPMEMVLNRLKSEFSFSRRLYFEFIAQETENELQHESCFSELFNEDLLGLDVEKLRTSFRLCFGILDKIGVAICELYDLYPPNGQVSFQSFWQLSRGDRREKFEAVSNPGLLALYSIATDLNDRKDGEWAFFKTWRNDLEHKFVVVHKLDKPNDVYSSYDFIDEIVFIKEDEFIDHLHRLLQITRSAIFSFVFTVRDKAMQETEDGKEYISMNILRQDYLQDSALISTMVKPS